MGTDTEPVRIRPSLRAWARSHGAPARLLPLLSLALIAWAQVYEGNGVGILVPIGCLVLFVAGEGAATLLVARVWTTDRAIHARGLLGRTRVVPRADVTEVLWMPGFRASGGPPTGLLLLLGAARRPLLRLEGERWGADRLAALAPALGPPVTVVADALTPGEVAWRRMYRLRWHEEHPALFALATVAGAVAFAVAFVLLASALDWQ